MNKTYISSLLVVLLAGAQTIRAQGSLEDVFAQLDAAEGVETTPVAPASVETAKAASVGTVAGEAANEASLEVADVAQDRFAVGVAFYDAGKYQEAKQVFEAILAENRYDRRANSYLKRIAAKISFQEKRLLEATRAEAMSQVGESWNPEFQNAIGAVVAPETPKENTEEKAIREMTEHLKGIVIPTLDFRDANIKDVVLFLTESCRRMDPSKKGVNMILLGLESDDSMGVGSNITISIRDMNLYEALQYIVEMASLKFEVEASVVTIMPVNYVRDVDVEQQSFGVIPEVGGELAAMSGEGDDDGGMDDLFGEPAAVAEPTGPVDVSAYFSIVDWPEGSSAIYYPNFKKLVVKNTPDNIKAVKGILDDLEDEAIKQRSQQVEIEAKFVEFSEGALEELGFDWNVYGSGSAGGFNLVDGSTYGSITALEEVDGSSPVFYTNPESGYYSIISQGQDGKSGENLFGSSQRDNTSAFESISSGVLSTMGGTPASMLFSNGDVDFQISAMEQEGTADVLSSPKVTTESGYEAVIRVVEIHRYPQDYDVETGQRTAPIVKPQDWEDFDLGVVLRVTPEVDPERNTIKLELNPEIRKFKGFEDYPVAVNAYVGEGIDADGDASDVPLGDGRTLFARMPYFETRSVQTRVTVADGSTIMMGGLVDERTETFRDQVPILGDIPYLGRLFRTEGSRTSKKNLVIYIKATQVDERGMTRADRAMAREGIQ